MLRDLLLPGGMALIGPSVFVASCKILRDRNYKKQVIGGYEESPDWYTLYEVVPCRIYRIGADGRRDIVHGARTWSVEQIETLIPAAYELIPGDKVIDIYSLDGTLMIAWPMIAIPPIRFRSGYRRVALESVL